MSELTDGNTPPLHTLLVYITNRCNLRCRHCYIDPVFSVPGSDPNEVSCQKLKDAVDQALELGLAAVRITGGEPFMRPDLLDLVRHIDSRNVRVILETNGTLISDAEAAALGGLKRSDGWVSVSLDGATAAVHDAIRGVRGCFDLALRGMDHLVRHKVAPQVIATLMELNRDEMEDIVRLSAERGARSFKLNALNRTGRGKTAAGDSDLPAIMDMDKRLCRLSESLGLDYCSPLPPALQSVPRLIQFDSLNRRCDLRHTLGILWDGTWSSCGMGKYASDFRFGHVDKDSIRLIWSEHGTIRRIRECIPKNLEGICSECIMRNRCEGYCRLHNEDVTLDSVCHPYWMCREADRLNLFPAGRRFRWPNMSEVSAAPGGREAGSPTSPPS
jgi:SynChlorMet cassette radical SAM/SPASM protein ScmF